MPAVLPPTSKRLRVTAGVSASSDHMSRALGRESSWLWSKLVCTRVAVASMVGASPVTVSSSSIVLRDSLMFTSAVKPMPMRIPSRTTLPNPASSKVTL